MEITNAEWRDKELKQILIDLNARRISTDEAIERLDRFCMDFAVAFASSSFKKLVDIGVVNKRKFDKYAANIEQMTKVLTKQQ